MPAIVSDIIALPGWNAPMLLLLAKATLILIAALGITIAMQRGSAGARHLVWLGTLATLLFVPAVTAWAPPLRLAILPPVVEQQKAQPTISTPAATKKTAITPPAQASVSLPAQVSPEVKAGWLSRLSGLSLALSVWGFIALAIALWLAWGAMVVRRIVNRAHPLDTHDWLTPFYEVADRLELENPPRLLSSSDANMPFACGFFKPTIVLPADCESWSADRRRAVLLHELAHVKRHDLVGHTLGRLACALYWFHPLVWTAAKQLRNESERACDDLALSCGARASDYAEHLLDIFTSVRRDSTPAVALAMARRKEFEGRMLAILDPELRHSMPSRRQSFALIGSLALMAIVVGAAAPAPRATAANVRLVSSVSAQDSDFSPKDVPLSEDLGTIGRHTSRSIDKAVNKSLGKTLDNTIDRTLDQTIGKSVDRSVDKSVDKTLARVFGKSFPSTITDAILGGKTQGRSDERATLLANILKTDADPSLRRTAAWGLSEYGEMNVATDALAQALRKDADPSVREMAAWSLAESSGNSTAVAALSSAIRSDANESVRKTAVWALGQVGDEYAVDPLVDALGDKNKDIRMRAAWSIGNLEPKQAPRALVMMLRDPDPEVRELTAWALYQIEDPSTADALNTALKSETNKELQIAYIRALAAMGEKSIDAVRTLLTSSDPKVRSMAVRALAGGNATGPWPRPWPQPRPFP